MVTYMIPCLLGLEKLVADEVKRLGLQGVQAENGRILCRGTAADCARLNINLRCGARVMMVLGQFPARSFEELFQGVRAIPWEDYLPRDAAFPVKGYLPAPRGIRLPEHHQEGHGGADEGGLRVGAVSGDGREGPGAVLHLQGRGRHLSGHLR